MRSKTRFRPVSPSPRRPVAFRQPSQRLLNVSLAPQAGRSERARRPDVFGGQVSFAERDCHYERAAPADLTLDARRPAVQFHQLLDEREADARTFVSATAGALNAVETLEQLRQIFRIDADAGVAHS